MKQTFTIQLKFNHKGDYTIVPHQIIEWLQCILHAFKFEIVSVTEDK